MNASIPRRPRLLDVVGNAYQFVLHAFTALVRRNQMVDHPDCRYDSTTSSDVLHPGSLHTLIDAQLKLDGRESLDPLGHQPRSFHVPDPAPKTHLKGVQRIAVGRAPIVDDLERRGQFVLEV